MCNDYEQHIRYAKYCKMMQDLACGIPTHQTELHMPQAAGIKIGDTGPARRAAGDNMVELAQMKFGFPSTGKAGPVFNFRSEGRHFGDSHRCHILASAFFEFMGTKYPSETSVHTVRPGFHGRCRSWREGAGNQPASFTLLTTDPGGDVEPYHGRKVRAAA